MADYTEEDLEEMAREAGFVDKATKEHGNEYWALATQASNEGCEPDGFTKWLIAHGYKKETTVSKCVTC